MEVMATTTFKPDIGHQEYNLLFYFNVKTTIKGHPSGSVRGRSRYMLNTYPCPAYFYISSAPARNTKA